MSTTQPRVSWKALTGYAATHCRVCKAGWTRTGVEGGVLTMCLLDREPVLDAMTDCDRFMPRVPDEDSLI